MAATARSAAAASSLAASSYGADCTGCRKQRTLPSFTGLRASKRGSHARLPSVERQSVKVQVRAAKDEKKTGVKRDIKAEASAVELSPVVASEGKNGVRTDESIKDVARNKGECKVTITRCAVI